MSDNDTKQKRYLAIERIGAMVRTLIRPGALDFYQVGAEARHGLQLEETRFYQSLCKTRDRGHAAATRLTVLAREPSSGPAARYEDVVNKREEGE